MRNIGKLTYDDLDKEINYAVANDITTTFIVNGSLASYIVDYLESEHGILQWTEDEDPFYDFEDNVVYNITYYDGEYYAEEAYAQKEDGEILLSFGDEDDVCYIQMETDLTTSDIKRIFCNDIILFTLEENKKSTKEENYLNKNYTKDNYTSVEYTNINGKKTYKVNGKEVSKDEYNAVTLLENLEDKYNDIYRFYNFLFTNRLKRLM